MPTKATLSSIALAGAVGAGAVFLFDKGEYHQVELAPEVTTNVLLDAAAPDCAAEVRLVGKDPQCSRCKTQLGNDDGLTVGWCCNGAFMGLREQACLDDAAKLLLPEPVEEPMGEPIP